MYVAEEYRSRHPFWPQLHSSPPGATIELRAGVEGGALAVRVEDHGSGIAPANRERLFRPFFTTKPRGKGTGLGLSRKIVREHGGQIDALPAADGGSVFRVLLPAEHGAPCAEPS